MGDEKVKQVKQEYERKINNMQSELKKLQAAQKEHNKLMRERTQHERQLRSLKTDLAEMKKVKVRVRKIYFFRHLYKYFFLNKDLYNKVFIANFK